MGYILDQVSEGLTSAIDGVKDKLSAADQYLSQQLGTDPNSPQTADARATRDSIAGKLSTLEQQQALRSAALKPVDRQTLEGGLGTPTGLVTGQVTGSDGVDFRVRLRAFPQSWNEVYGDPDPANLMYPLHPEASSGGFLGTNGMFFPYTPTINWSGSASYQTINVVHSNQDFKAYSHTPSQSFTISGLFTAQNPQEARYMLACIHFLRTVTKMRYGESKNLGLPPPVLLLSGYGKYIFNDLPVIVENYSLDYQSNSDMVPVSVPGDNGIPGAWVPVTQNISVTVTVQQTPDKLRKFDFNKYASGSLMGNGGGWV